MLYRALTSIPIMLGIANLIISPETGAMPRGFPLFCSFILLTSFLIILQQLLFYYYSGNNAIVFLKKSRQQYLLFGNYLSRPFLLLNLSVLRTFRQRGTPKWKKGEEQIKPDKNRHFLPLFPLRFPPLDSPFLNPFFPLFCRFLPALSS